MLLVKTIKIDTPVAIIHVCSLIYAKTQYIEYLLPFDVFQLQPPESSPIETQAS